MACSGKKSNKYASGGRVKATIAKAGVTKNRNRRYSCGGKIKTK
jgi:hypothetical protein